MPISKREFLIGAAGMLVSGLNRAAGQCTPSSYLRQALPGLSGGVPQVCNAFIDPKHIVVASQSNSEWCWAAATSMLFAVRGFTVSQERIVQRGIGQLANRPGDLQAFNNVLNTTWSDDAGRRFRSNARILYSADLQIGSISNAEIIATLRNDQPLLYCNLSHAMVLVQVNYIPPEEAPRNVVAALVVDPWPGIGLRSLTPPELATPPIFGAQARLLATVGVSQLDS